MTPPLLIDGARRVLVLGCPGAGKTTFARRLGRASGLPVFHLDDLYWKENWTRMEPERWHGALQELVKRSAWIIDGNYLESVALRAKQAELIIIITVPAWVSLTRICKRTLAIRNGESTFLPAALRRQVDEGGDVPATHDLGRLMRKALSFNRNELPAMTRLSCDTSNCFCLILYQYGRVGKYIVKRHLKYMNSDRVTWMPTGKFLQTVVRNGEYRG